ncbi:neuroendocrine convertase 2-like [Cimex lectularius]|uniref:Peptidase S8 pro-domain domain-containing protein n=1 Tax=Cimex lectularius TaxID=79782 RepID=A0A8I6SH60_CIMLE|nr:neuroendocrine convertase 2-like [Cimex lectularius]
MVEGAYILIALVSTASAEVFTNSFFVKLHGDGGRDTASLVAARTGFDNFGPVLGSDNEFHFVHRGLAGARTKRSMPHTRRLKVDPLVQYAYQLPGFKRVKRGYKPLNVENLVPHIKPERDPTDPYFTFQWYLKNTGQNGGKPKLDLNVEAAWAQGVTGKNVTTAIMDDGVDYMHEDLKYNYVSNAINLTCSIINQVHRETWLKYL